jgi:hypothetical protein
MTVLELIELLQKLPQDMDVLVADNVSDEFDVYVMTAEVHTSEAHDTTYVRIGV